MCTNPETFGMLAIVFTTAVLLIPIRNERIWGRILSGVSAVYDLKAV